MQIFDYLFATLIDEFSNAGRDTIDIYRIETYYVSALWMTSASDVSEK
jgi:hypothetical protein